MGPPAEYELFKRFAREASNGFSIQDAAGAASNIIINALQISHPTRAQAEASFDELFGRLKTMLMEHYDHRGLRRMVLPINGSGGPSLFTT